MKKVLVVGAGFAGAVVARELAENGWQVLVIDRREHVGGNAHDELDDHGVLIHRYGPHSFHTHSVRIFQYVRRFTSWRQFELRVLASVEGRLLPIPINQETINRLYSLSLDEQGVSNYLESVREKREQIRNSEDVVLNAVGRDLYEKFYLGYTRKQWNLEPSQLSASVTARIPVHYNSDDRYFQDPYQGVPADGYFRLFENILDHPHIRVELGVDFLRVKDRMRADQVVYTGPVDAFFGYCYGKLPYRSLHFEHQHITDREYYQPVAVVNYPNEHDFTRITEFKHMTGQKHPGTSIVREYPRAAGEPYYPIPRPENEVLYQEYKALAAKERGVTFVGRLAQYRYYNMDQVVGAALKTADFLLGRSNAS